MYDSRDVASKLMQYHGQMAARSTNPIYDAWARNHFYYYSNVIDSTGASSSLGFVGEQGELVQMRVPQARSLTRQLLTLITKQKLAFSAVAETTDRSVVEEMRIADAICEDTVKDQTVDVRAEKMVEHGLVIGTGYMKTTWRTDRGSPFIVGQDGQVVFEGDNEISIPFVTDVLFDYSQDEWDNNDWVEVRVKRNRYDLLAEFPELKNQIISLPSCRSETTRSMFTGLSDDDNVYVYELYHKPTPALPKGRMMFYSNAQTVYLDGENLYGCIPVEQFKPEHINGVGFGYPMFSALLPAQEMFDHEMSVVATNHSALGIHNVTAPRGAAIEVQELYGLNFLSYTPQPIPGGGKPEGLNLMQASPESFKMMESLLGSMQQMSNINAALRGDVGQSTSGVAIATLTTNALEFLNSYTRAYYKCLERTMFHAVNNITRFAGNEREVRLVGKNHQTYTKRFKGDQLKAIKSVKIQSINPLMQTIAGRLEIAKDAITNGFVRDMTGYAKILDGEPLSTLTEDEQSQADLIAEENQMLLDGEAVLISSIDNHPQHMMKHMVIINSQKARQDKKLYARTMDHILEHYGYSGSTDPNLLAMVNTGRLPQMDPNAMPPPGGPARPDDQPPEVGDRPPGDSGEMPGQGKGIGGALPQAKPAQDLVGRSA
jgi:hypothetical protein